MPTAVTQSGYTLIEMLVVLTIMALVTTIAIPIGGRMIDHVTLRADARQLASRILALEQRAVDQEATIRVTEDHSRQGLVALPDHRIALPNGGTVQILGAQHRFSLFADGTCSGARLRLTKGGHSLTLNISWLTGHIDFQAPP